jgi:hypothetical protein
MGGRALFGHLLRRCEFLIMGPTDHSPLLLSPSEVQEITGFKVRRHQAAWLQRKGWRFEINGAGRPVVARRYAEKMLGCAGDDVGPSAPAPNFGAILRAI